MKKYPGRLFLGILIFGSGPALGAGEHAATDPGKGPISDYRELTANETTIQAVLDTYGRAMEQKSRFAHFLRIWKRLSVSVFVEPASQFVSVCALIFQSSV